MTQPESKHGTHLGSSHSVICVVDLLMFLGDVVGNPIPR